MWRTRSLLPARSSPTTISRSSRPRSRGAGSATGAVATVGERRCRAPERRRHHRRADQPGRDPGARGRAASLERPDGRLRQHAARAHAAGDVRARPRLGCGRRGCERSDGPPHRHAPRGSALPAAGEVQRLPGGGARRRAGPDLAARRAPRRLQRAPRAARPTTACAPRASTMPGRAPSRGPAGFHVLSRRSLNDPADVCAGGSTYPRRAARSRHRPRGRRPAERLQAGLWPSDHAGVVATLAFSGNVTLAPIHPRSHTPSHGGRMRIALVSPYSWSHPGGSPATSRRWPRS